LDETDCDHDDPQVAHSDHQVQHVLDEFFGKTVDEECHEPFADPHGGVYAQQQEHVGVEAFIGPFEDVLEDKSEDIVEGEAVFIQPEQNKSFICCQVCEEIKALVLRVADYDEVADDEVDALRITHFGEVVSDSF
jgi:hypothetical protein